MEPGRSILVLAEAIAEIAVVNRESGVAQRGGKRYTMVADRVAVWRRHFGTEHGIETEILRDDGQYVQVRATIRDDAGRVLATGLAEEVRGSSAVNKTSALENCETSAIGRSLASLSLSGGEFASLDEILIARAHEATEAPPPPPRSSGAEMPTAPPPSAPSPPAVVADDLPFAPEDERTDWAAWVAEQIAGMAGHRNTAEHRLWSSTVRPYRERLAGEDAALHDELLAAYVDRRRTLENR